MTKRKSIIILLAFFIITAISYAFYVWNTPHRNVSKETGIKISATALFDSFSNNENTANNLFLNKTIEVKGKVTAVKVNNAGQTVIYLQSNDPVFGVNCTFSNTPRSIKKDETIVFKGICTGYLDDVILNNGQLTD
jgi:hypothetical protein